jgi:ABC-type sugar transport system substrate-binding protein
MALCLLVLGGTMGLLACGDSSSGGASSGGDDKYSAVLSNGFVGNDWRVQMQRAAVALAEKPPLEERISSMKLFTTQNGDVAQQNAALQTAIQQKPDILLLVASSANAHNGAVERACAAGTTVVTFDVQATAPCAWKFGPDFYAVGRARGEWMAKTIGGEGEVFVDWGISGNPATEAQAKGAQDALDKFPKIETYKYYSQVTPGGETSGVTQLLAAHRDVKGIVAQAYGAYALKAVVRSGLKPIPIAGWAYNVSLQTCQQYDAPCLFVSNPAWISGEATRLAVKIRDKKLTGEPRFIRFTAPVFVSNDVPVNNTDLGPVSSIDKAIDPNAPGSVFVPITPSWANLTVAEAVGE